MKIIIDIDKETKFYTASADFEENEENTKAAMAAMVDYSLRTIERAISSSVGMKTYFLKAIEQMNSEGDRDIN